MKNIRFAAFVLLFLLFLCGACQLYKLERELPPDQGEFISQARYIMTSEERQFFLRMPDSDRAAFVEDFWKRRDPDPTTEENEFKMEYMARVERTKELFPGEGVPGWQTDRGRIYILYGPPQERQTQLLGTEASGRCGEVWYYRGYPVIFRDSGCRGTFRLATFDLSALRDLDISASAGIPMAPGKEKGLWTPAPRIFEYGAEILLEEKGPKRVSGKVRVTQAFDRIWFTSEGRSLKTSFEVILELRDAAKALVWEKKAVFPIALLEDDLSRKAGQEFVMDVPLVIEDEAKIALLGRSGAQLLVTVVNSTGGEKQKKYLPFSL